MSARAGKGFTASGNVGLASAYVVVGDTEGAVGKRGGAEGGGGALRTPAVGAVRGWALAEPRGAYWASIIRRFMGTATRALLVLPVYS